MSLRVSIVVVALAAVAAAGAARADSGPVIVIPSRPGVQVIINGVDASYAVVEGDWGLARPGHGEVRVIGGARVLPNPIYTRRYSYHPRYGAPPPRGRNEIEPAADRVLPPPAETFSRSWGTVIEPPPERSAQPRIKVGGEDVPPTMFDPETFQQPPTVVVPPRGRRP